jgi:hypothetical protein
MIHQQTKANTTKGKIQRSRRELHLEIDFGDTVIER